MVTPTMKEVYERLVRVEARLCQLMVHLGMDPQVQKYPKEEVPKEKPVES